MQLPGLLGTVRFLHRLRNVKSFVGSSLVSSGHNILRKTKVFSEVGQTLRGEEEVLVSPVVNFSDISSGKERLHEHQGLEIGHIDLRVGLLESILLHNNNTLFKEVREDENSVFFSDEHF